MSEPRIEILVVRDPDGDTDVTVFIDGVQTSFVEEGIDVGYGSIRTEWDDQTQAIRDGIDDGYWKRSKYTPAFRDLVVEQREAWKEHDYVEDDRDDE